jgi:hypothetical protein
VCEVLVSCIRQSDEPNVADVKESSGENNLEAASKRQQRYKLECIFFFLFFFDLAICF